MALYERFAGTAEGVDNISAHMFMAALGEVQRGEMSNAQAVAAFNLDAQEQTEALAILDKMNVGGLTRVMLHDVLLLTADHIAPYDDEAAVKARLGF